MKTNITLHACVERWARIEYIIDSVGIGDVVFSACNPYTKRIEELTNTGVLIVRSPTDNAVITMFIVSISKATAIFRKNGYNRIPDSLYSKIISNKYYYENQPV